MIRFDSDYVSNAHPRILDRLQETSLEQNPGYGTDSHCERARAYIREACKATEAEVQFMVGGTQANATIIASILRPHQGVISPHTGHIATHESGAIEARGHKILTLPANAGKITAEQIQEAYDAHWSNRAHEHMVQPGLVYISQSTESGTAYTLGELEAIHQVCRKTGLPLMIDGARLGYGLAAKDSDMRLEDVARLCDVFYIGGTKLGALFGEAVVITNPKLKQDFRYLMKQQGGLLAKGFLLGLQFECLFEDGLYWELSRHGVGEALYLEQAFLSRGLPMQYATQTNQLFPLLPNPLVEKLSQAFAFHQWEKPDAKHTVIRLCTSWATRREDVEVLIAALD